MAATAATRLSVVLVLAVRQSLLVASTLRPTPDLAPAELPVQALLMPVVAAQLEATARKP
jgi:hypothetical protein